MPRKWYNHTHIQQHKRVDNCVTDGVTNKDPYYIFIYIKKKKDMKAKIWGQRDWRSLEVQCKKIKKTWIWCRGWRSEPRTSNHCVEHLLLDPNVEWSGKRVIVRTRWVWGKCDEIQKQCVVTILLLEIPQDATIVSECFSSWIGKQIGHE